jgi:hypothetical protein
MFYYLGVPIHRYNQSMKHYININIIFLSY